MRPGTGFLGLRIIGWIQEEFMGLKIDDENNHVRGKEIKITTDDSTIAAYTIPTNEELMIAQDTYDFARLLDGFRA